MASSTRADETYRRVRGDILNGKFAPGIRLRIDELSQRYGVSSGVLREVLPRLVGQGLAVLLPQQGFRVVSISVLDLRHLTEARASIETQVLRQSIEAGDSNWEAEVLASHHRLLKTTQHTPDGDIPDDWAFAHAEFHRALLHGCANERLRLIAESLREASEVYRYWSKTPGEERHRDIVAEHQQICDLALERDTDGAVAALRHHIELTTALLLEGRPEEDASDSA